MSRHTTRAGLLRLLLLPLLLSSAAVSARQPVRGTPVERDIARLTSYGGAAYEVRGALTGQVTGSQHILQLRDKRVMVDCGMFQGKGAAEKNGILRPDAHTVDAVVLTHAHIDHCGMLPLLVKNGYRGQIHMTPATAELAKAILLDSAKIQEMNADRAKKTNVKYSLREGQRGWRPEVPMYTTADVESTVGRFVTHPYGQTFSPVEGISTHLVDAGHLLGSASAIMDMSINGRARRMVFGGDLGRRNSGILNDPTVPARADYVVMEATYGGRVHAAPENVKTQLLAEIQATFARGGNLVIPAFAQGRTQELLYALKQLSAEGRLTHNGQPVKVFVDSPLAISVTEAFRRNIGICNANVRSFAERNGNPFEFNGLTFSRTADDSKAIANVQGPKIIIAASGMCDNGRIVHHLKNNLGNPNNTILLAGYQSPWSLGGQLTAEQRPRSIKIFGQQVPVQAKIERIGGISAHADQRDLLWWSGSLGEQVSRFFLVHGDTDQLQALKGALTGQQGRRNVTINTEGATYDLD
ncbi:MAG: MBL fold metallo-hydrolase [Deltaproteobacteria bacterium]|nr:MBL fold metallo-hydrolase [Deltaproteobacteria bacterium]